MSTSTIIILITIFFDSFTFGSTSTATPILFESTPSSFLPEVDSSLSLHCGWPNDTSVTQTPSIVIMRSDPGLADQDIASINSFHQAKSLTTNWNLTVTGGLDLNGTEQGFLNVKFISPDEGAAGTYKCVVSGIDIHGHPVSYTQTVDVTVRSPPSVNQLLKQLLGLESNINHQSTTMSNQDLAIQEWQEKVKNITRINEDLKNMSATQEILITKLDKERQDLLNELHKSARECNQSINILTTRVNQQENSIKNQGIRIQECQNTTRNLNELKEQLGNLTTNQNIMVTNLHNQEASYAKDRQQLTNDFHKMTEAYNKTTNSLTILVDQHENKIELINKNQQNQDNLLASTTTDINHNKDQINSLQASLNTQKNQLTSLQSSQGSRITQLSNQIRSDTHIESGVIDCSLDSNHLDRTITKYFTRSYSSNPDVTLAISSVRFYDSTSNNDWKDAVISLQSVWTTGFRVRCYTTDYEVPHLMVAWISIP